MQQVPLLGGDEQERERELRKARLQLLWPDSLKKAAQEYAEREDRSLNDLTIEAVRLLLAGRNPKAA